MGKRSKIRKCLCCGEKLAPGPHNKHHQEYCRKNECRRISHCASSKRYRKNQRGKKDYRIKERDRKREWRKKNPDYEKNQKMKKKQKKDSVSRDFARGEKASFDYVYRDLDSFFMACIKGLVFKLTGVSREDIGSQMKYYYDNGNEPDSEFEKQFKQGVFANAAKRNHQSGAKTEASRGVRVGGSPPGARKFNQQI